MATSAKSFWRSPSSSPPPSAITAVVWRHDDARVTLARRGVYAVFFLLLACIVIIEVSFATNDFSLNIVAEHSSIETPMFYKLAAMWSSQEGSLLLWSFVLSIVRLARPLLDPPQAARDRPVGDRR